MTQPKKTRAASADKDSTALQDQRRLRRVLGNFATGVTVITARGKGKVRVGVTANSFNSVSLDPPLVLWSLAKSAESLPVFKAAEHFVVHVLAEEQVHLSDHFARKRADKFADVPFSDGPGGAPLIEECAARFECRTAALHDGGDHWIIVGEVLKFEDSARPALVYYQGGYAMSVPYQDDDAGSNDTGTSAGFEQGMYYQLVRAVHAVQDTFPPLHDQFSISTIEARVLGLLRNGALRDDADIAHHVRSPLPELRAVLHDMQVRQLVASRPDAPAHWQLTDAGTTLAERLWQAWIEHENRVLSTLSAGEADVLLRSLRRIGDWADSD